MTKERRYELDVPAVCRVVPFPRPDETWAMAHLGVCDHVRVPNGNLSLMGHIALVAPMRRLPQRENMASSHQPARGRLQQPL